MGLGYLACRRFSVAVFLWGAPFLRAASPPVTPATVCEILANPDQYSGKAVAILGRYSFRSNGRWVSEDGCEHKLTTGEYTWPNVVWLAVDSKSAPEVPLVLEIDGIAANQKLKRIQQHTILREFRFGSSDYDRWAVVYGRVEVRPQLSDTKPNGFGLQNAAPAQLLIRGDGAIVFLHDQE
jgi:hypothetical protein